MYLHAAPLCHVGGLSSALAMLLAGARHVFLPRFDAAGALAAIQKEGVTAFIAVPAMVADLVAEAAGGAQQAQHAHQAQAPQQAAQHAAQQGYPNVARVLVGGGGLAPPLLAGLAALFPRAAVHSAYGMTETASSLTFDVLRAPGGSTADTFGAGTAASNSSTSGSGAAGPAGPTPAGGVFVGRPPPGVEIAVYQPPAEGAPPSAGGGVVALAGAGEVVTRGPHLMLGYWDDDAATAAALLPGGWLRTGDLGHLAAGERAEGGWDPRLSSLLCWELLAAAMDLQCC